MFHLEREKALVCTVKKSFDCVNCQNEILIVSESVKDEPLSCGDKEAARSSDIFISTFMQMLHLTQNQITLTLLLTSWKKPCSHVHAHYTNLLHDELRLRDRSTKRSIWSTDFIESFSIHWSPISAHSAQLTLICSTRQMFERIKYTCRCICWQVLLSTTTYTLSLSTLASNMGKSWLQSMAVPKNITVPAPILIFGAKFFRLQASRVPLWVKTWCQSQTPLVGDFIWVDNR